MEISQKLISYFWEYIENEILHLTNLYLNVECESRLSKPREHQIASKDRAWSKIARDNSICQVTKLL